MRILSDCDEDCLIYEVQQTGAACHTGYMSCFYRTLDGTVTGSKVFDPEKVYKKPGHYPTGSGRTFFIRLVILSVSPWKSQAESSSGRSGTAPVRQGG